jgi:hypothetical protein
VVSVFPSYKFKSTTWDLVKYHFRSLDTWLDGVCKSCCAEHKWESDLLAIEAAAGKRSIFYDGDGDDEDVNAGGVDEDQDVSAGGGGDGDTDSDYAVILCTAVTEAAANLTFTQENPGDMELASAAPNDAPNDVSVDTLPSQAGCEASSTTPCTSETIIAVVATSAIFSENAQKGAATMSARSRSFDEIASPSKTSSVTSSSVRYNSPSKSSTKQPTLSESPSGPSKVSRRARQAPAAAITKASNSNGMALTTSADSLDREGAVILTPAQSSAAEPGLASSKNGRVRSMSSSMDSLAKSTKDGPLTYYVCKANGWPLVKAALDKRG